MNAKTLAGLGLLGVLSGCSGVLVVDNTHRHYPPPPRAVVVAPAPVVVAQPAPVIVAQPAPVVVAQPAPVVVAQPVPVVVAPRPVIVAPAPVVVAPAPVVVAAAPVFVEEGARVGGVVVAAPVGVSEYVFINGGWYYYHPGMRQWVHAHHPGNWRPPANVHVYYKWEDHPQYHHH